MSRELTDAEYVKAVSLCRAVVEAATSDDGGPTVAGSFLGRLRDLLPARPEGPRGNYAAGITPQEGRPATSVELSGQSGAVPDVRLLPDGRVVWRNPSLKRSNPYEWVVTITTEGQALWVRADQLPLSDAERLVPVGPLMDLVGRWEIKRGAYADEADGSCYAKGKSLAHADVIRDLRDALDSLLGDSPESTNRQEGGND